ncbi:septum site-determining protein MinC [Neisseria leonii]|uniref:Probable septum site-determining protein MinC n=1 Tax=Neisseria leonii TaxID=2995413 RepID=A0A9X4IDL6_9NEIS|nr:MULTISPECIES: septum site-determining protein MinC [unclassified Neisseria]MDD9325678.1 septum site-determining protein MinC [Neisseria sp. 3986]MDD9327821.1 septum site-determining protein MinC [Neisseria sp. 51.81]
MNAAFKVKSARLDALAFLVENGDAGCLDSTLAESAQRYRAMQLPLLLDMQAFAQPQDTDLAALLAVFARHGLTVCALRHENEAWAQAAAENGLAFSIPNKAGYGDIPEPAETVPVPTTVINRPTVFVSTSIRTGQQVYAEGADLIVTGVVSEGAEIIADGNIHVYAPMRGRALAGADGRRDARIFIHSMQAELVSVAGIYRNFEQDLPGHLHKKPVQVYLQDDRLVISAIED